MEFGRLFYVHNFFRKTSKDTIISYPNSDIIAHQNAPKIY